MIIKNEKKKKIYFNSLLNKQIIIKKIKQTIQNNIMKYRKIKRTRYFFAKSFKRKCINYFFFFVYTPFSKNKSFSHSIE
jgi:hypothetical protein